MQNSAVDVEVNLLIRRAKLKEEEMKNIDPEESTSLEVKLDILVSVVEEMMQKITQGMSMMGAPTVRIHDRGRHSLTRAWPVRHSLMRPFLGRFGGIPSARWVCC